MIALCWVGFVIVLLFLSFLILSSRKWKRPRHCNESYKNHLPYKVIHHRRPSRSALTEYNPSLVQAPDGQWILATRACTLRDDGLVNLLSRYARPFRSYICFYKLNSTGTEDAKEKQSVNSEEGKVGQMIRKHAMGQLSGHYRFQWQDPRLTFHDGRLYLIATRKHSSTGTVYPALFRWERNPNRWEQRPLQIPDTKKFEKNWCALSHPHPYPHPQGVNRNPYKGGDDPQVRFLIHTDTYPVWRIREMDVSTGSLQTLVEWDSRSFFPSDAFPNIRGSTSMVPFSSTTYLVALHTFTSDWVGTRTYRTVLAEVDRMTLLPARKCYPLCIAKQHEIIQFTSTLAAEDDTLSTFLMGMGLADAAYQIIRIKRAEIECRLF